MLIKMNYYLVTYVNLQTGKCHEKEMSDFQVDTFELIGSVVSGVIQILNKKYLKTKDLMTGSVYKFTR
ncbi:hypothetical protein AB1283_00725 [Bacillus sp. S13(2024)]|uniref:hypothetical protein n=1 Tax=Bacillus sp. S13(2024) TaxID=3162885 RepID=UPI003D2468B4